MKQEKRLLVLNSLVPPKYGGAIILSSPISGEDLCADMYRILALARNGESYVGHLATAKLLGVSCSRMAAEPQHGDFAIIVRLKARQSTPGDQDVSWDDLEIRFANYWAEGDYENYWCPLNLFPQNPLAALERMEEEFGLRGTKPSKKQDGR